MFPRISNHVSDFIAWVNRALIGIRLIRTRKYKSWKTTILLPWAAALMIAGFATRLYGAYHTNDLGILIASVVLIMSGP